MNILITGATGLIGTALKRHFKSQTHVVKALNRGIHASNGDQPFWDIRRSEINLKGFEPEVVVHLAGENIAARWTASRKASILSSRVDGTRLLVSHLVAMENPPKVLLSGSAVGFYGLRGDESVDEDAPASDDFISEVCVAWEAETEPARIEGIRVVLLRTGVVLAKHGGALAKMLPAFKTGVGGIIGSGEQYMSWLTLADTVSMIEFIMHSDLEGPVNLTAPNPSRNREFTKALGKAVRRPTFIPVPSFAAKTIFGEMANEVLLGGAKVIPKKLVDAGYAFKHKTIGEALKAVLKA